MWSIQALILIQAQIFSFILFSFRYKTSFMCCLFTKPPIRSNIRHWRILGYLSSLKTVGDLFFYSVIYIFFPSVENVIFSFISSEQTYLRHCWADLPKSGMSADRLQSILKECLLNWKINPAKSFVRMQNLETVWSKSMWTLDHHIHMCFLGSPFQI